MAIRKKHTKHSKYKKPKFVETGNVITNCSGISEDNHPVVSEERMRIARLGGILDMVPHPLLDIPGMPKY